MHKRRSMHEDEVQAAFRVAAQATGNLPKKPAARKKPKNPAAVALGRLGGLAAGKTRKDKIPEARRIEIAKKAALARWGKRSPGS